MNAHSKNESWVVDRGGQVVERKAQVGVGGLSDWERLVYCLWVADYMMRNAGDFANAVDMYPTFQSDAQQFAQRLGLTATREAFPYRSGSFRRSISNASTRFVMRYGALTQQSPCAAAKPAIALRLQSWRPVGRVAELGSYGVMTPCDAA